MQKKILLVGEFWISMLMYVKGFDQFVIVIWYIGVMDFLVVFVDSFYVIIYMFVYVVVIDFLLMLEVLQEWDVIIFLDIGVNMLLLYLDIWLKSC